ncbi:MAG: SPFH domain-containing protein [Lachnospiraceae bacterium]|nr:SPFH domain-containing protein [Lachnospiraceae bacterium]MBR4145138.1 SPFH domain-containing protein [Lachnospiraceae bacterium]MBR6476492.1 SPFH domain-containing protein [Lachnospiraceae bacterium]
MGLISQALGAIGNIAGGAINAGLGAASGVLANQWKEFIYCDSIPDDTLMVKGKKQITGKSSNTKGDDNIISNGSGIVVNDGQCMIIVENGKVVEVCAEPGRFTYDTSLAPSIFAGKFGQSLLDSFKMFGQQFAYGGQAANDQRVYYFNTKVIMGNKYGTPAPVPFRLVDSKIFLDLDITIRLNAIYSYRLVDPLLFYTKIAGNVNDTFRAADLEQQLKSEISGKLNTALAKISAMEIRYNELPAHTEEMSEALKEQLHQKWVVEKGIELVSFDVNSANTTEENEKLIRDAQAEARYQHAGLGAAALTAAQAQALKDAAKNPNGAANAMFGVGMIGGGMNGGIGNTINALYAQAGQEQAAAAAAAPVAAAPAANTWKCPKCGADNTGNFCQTCGEKKPEAPAAWKCPKCGNENTGNFCQNCGEKKPEAPATWTCAKCGAVNTGNFCQTCGEKKPE